MKQHNGGFTLVELLVTLVCCSLVTLGAVTFLMTSLRVETQTEGAISRRQTARIVLTALEKLTGSGQVAAVEQEGDDWSLRGSDGTVLLRYAASDHALLSEGDTVLMDGLEDARAQVDEEKRLLTLSLSTEGKTYDTSVFCREGMALMGRSAEEVLDEAIKEPEDPVAGTETGRLALLKALATQYGSTGAVLNDGVMTGMYYSQWYCGGNFWEDWNENTPWCACFLSWGVWRLGVDMTQAGEFTPREPALVRDAPEFADVDDGVAYFKSRDLWTAGGGARPVPGDFIFFNWDGDRDADHVGAVLLVEGGAVYTIEGNSGGRVAVRVYPLNDPRILGYGTLDWIVPEPSES